MMITLPWLAGAAVSECDQGGGARAAARESESLQKAVAAGFTGFQIKTGENLSQEPATFDWERAEPKLFEEIPKVLAMLEAKESAEVVDLYKMLVLDVAHRVAAAAGSGFMATGQKVSAAEAAMVDRIAGALKATHLLETVKKNAEPGKLK